MKINVSYVPVDDRSSEWNGSYKSPYISDEMIEVEDFTFSLKEKERGEYELSYEMRGDGKMNARRLTVNRATCEVHDDGLDG